MKVALAQIDMRLGDFEGIAARIESQVRLAAEAGANVLCAPAPLMGGVLPGSLIEEPNYEHDLLAALTGLAAAIEPTGVICLVPAPVSFAGAALFEVFMLKEGRVVPCRTAIARQRERVHADMWAPPIFDAAGVRIAVTFDVERDMPELPVGCDLVLYFQVSAFDATNSASAGVAAVSDGHFKDIVSKKSLWMACMAPVGGFDEAVYTGGSFVMDDCGRVVAAAPCFEEALLVQEVQRGMTLPAVEEHELPHFNHEEWLWGALRLSLMDAAVARGYGRVALVLSGDLSSSLAAALAVDAFGPRNVFGLFIERADVFTPAQEAAEERRARVVRELAASLNIRLIERGATDLARIMDRDVPPSDAPRLHARLEALYLEDVARTLDLMALSSLTKTDYALAAASCSGALEGTFAPFGDIYLTSLEFLARTRNRASAAIPPSLVTLNAVEDRMGQIVARAIAGATGMPEYLGRMAQILASLEPVQIDGVLEAHVDRGLPLDEIPLAAERPEAVAVLVMLVRRGELARRGLPVAPVVSARSFSERAWPWSLAWSDLGLHGAERLSVDDLARREIERYEAGGADRGDRVREEILSLLGNLLGFTPEQMEELKSEEGQQRIKENMERFESQIQEALGSMMGGTDGAQPPMPGQMPPAGPGGFPFFSQN